MVTKHENEEDYEYMFNALKRIVKEIHQIDFEPTILLAEQTQLEQLQMVSVMYSS